MKRGCIATALLALTLTWSSFGCDGDKTDGDPPSPTTTPPGTTTTTEPPPTVTCTDPALFTPDDVEGFPGYTSQSGVAHKLFNPTADVRSNKLAVFLHGTEGNPAHHINIIGTAAYSGLKAIGLAYDNGGTAPGNMSEICEDFGLQEDPDCTGNVRRDRVYGGGYLDSLAAAAPGTVTYDTDVIDEDASAVGELYDLLVLLTADFPAVSWSDYYDDSQACQDHDTNDDGLALAGCIAWDEIILSGYSQGGGDASLLSVEQGSYATVIFSSPKDRVAQGSDPSFAPAGWMTPGATAGIDRWGLYHINEGGAPAGEEELNDGLEENWDALEFPGTTEDGAENTPFADLLSSRLQRFSTALTPSGDDSDYHGSIGVDSKMAVGSIPSLADPYEYDLFGVYLYMFCAAASP